MIRRSAILLGFLSLPSAHGVGDEPPACEARAEPLYQKALVVARDGDAQRTLDTLGEAMEAGVCPTRVLTEQAFAGLHVETRFHELIRGHARQWSTVMVTKDEPGSPMVVSGIIRDAAGTAVANALVHVFHADAKGEYTPTRAMDEPHSRIFGYLRTDAEGRYLFRTVRPGGYQKSVALSGEPRLIPEHIHFEVSADGMQPLQFQMVFDDDPRMDEHWRNEWAPSVNAPIVKVTRDDTGVQTCRHDLILHRRPTGGE